jgi:site-specific recombinase XerD
MKHLIWLRKNTINNKGNATIYVRITLAGDRIEISTGLQCQVQCWNTAKHRVKGATEKAMSINQRLNEIEAELLAYCRDKAEQPISKDQIICIVTRDEQKLVKHRKSLSDFARIYLDQVKAKKLEANSNRSIISRVNKICTYFEEKGLAKKTIALIGQSELKEYLEFISSEHEPGYVKKIWQIIQQIFAIAIEAKQQHQDILKGLTLPVINAKEIVYLDNVELAKLQKHEPCTPTLKRVKDLFLFQCYTGMAVADLFRIKPTMLKNINGASFFEYNRKKTKKDILVPVLPVAKQIFDSYGGVMPKFADQVYNRYIKELMEEVGIKKDISSHVGRKTFATMLIDNNISMQTVKVVLGHSDQRVTEQHYAKVQAGKVAREFRGMI